MKNRLKPCCLRFALRYLLGRVAGAMVGDEVAQVTGVSLIGIGQGVGMALGVVVASGYCNQRVLLWLRTKSPWINGHLTLINFLPVSSTSIPLKVMFCPMPVYGFN